MNIRTAKTRSPYGKIYWCSFAIIVFCWEVYLQSLPSIEYPITARLESLLCALILSVLPVIGAWFSDRSANKPSRQ